jgi:hypothetical protein
MTAFNTEMHEVCGTSRVWNLGVWRRPVTSSNSASAWSRSRVALVVIGHDEWMVEDVRSSPNEVIVELIERGVRCEC